MIQVELFDEREVTSDGQEPDEEALAIIKELGLATDDDGDRISNPSPNLQQWFVINTVFPQRTKIKNYKGPIPLRVLKEARSYLSEHPGQELIICHQAMSLTRDPIMLACKKDWWQWDQSNADASGFSLIARWGDALEDWDELANKGAVAVRKSMIAACDTMIAKLNMLKAMAPTMALRNNTIPMIQLVNIPDGL